MTSALRERGDLYFPENIAVCIYARNLEMLTESFVASLLTAGKHQNATNSTLKDAGIVIHELQPQSTLRQVYKKSSAAPGCLAVSETHIYAAQDEKAVVNVYNRAKGNQEATVPFPERILSVLYLPKTSTLALGTDRGKLMLWEVGTGRLVVSAAAHLQPVSKLCASDRDLVLSGSADSSIHVWSVSDLLSFLHSSISFGTNDFSRQPLSTFSGHRAAITALSCGHSKSHMNFALSASDDQKCYLWRMTDSQILRTFLLPSTALCAVLDPADRAVYLTYESGHIQSIDLYDVTQHNEAHSTSENVAPKQLKLSDAWQSSSSTSGATTCATLSYDATLLLTGHDQGKICSWDVAKGRFLKEITNFYQPVSSITMLRPDGFLNRATPRMLIPTVVKPKMELSAPVQSGSLGLPPTYTLYAQVEPHVEDDLGDDFTQDLTAPYFSRDVIDDAIQDMLLYNTDRSLDGATSRVHDRSDELNLARVERLQDQNAQLELKLSNLGNYIAEQEEKRRDRLKRRDELQGEKLRAFFQATKDGKSGLVAMEEWDDKIREVDMEDT